jgi:hypothetical protein
MRKDLYNVYTQTFADTATVFWKIEKATYEDNTPDSEAATETS